MLTVQWLGDFVLDVTVGIFTWVRDFAMGILRICFSECAMRNFSKVFLPFKYICGS